MKHLKKFESYSSNRVDDLLDKINDQGIDSLTDEEKEILKSNGVLPGGEEKPVYKDSYGYGDDEDDIDPDDIEDDDEIFTKDDLSDMAESDKLKGVSKDWIKRRDKARELYDFPANKDKEEILAHIYDVLEYATDKKNAPIFKEKVIKFLLNHLNNIDIDNEFKADEDNAFFKNVISYLEAILDGLHNKYFKK